MNVEEKVATLEALLARVQNNAAKPRIPRPAGAAPPNGGAHLAAPEPTVAAPKVATAKPVEKIAPARAEASPAQDSIDAHLAKLLDVKVEKPIEAKVEKPVEAKVEKPIEKPVEAEVDLLDVWAEALQDEVPKVQPATPVVAPKVDEGASKPAPIAARSVTPVAAKPVAVRPVTPAARPIAPRPTFGSKPEVTPAPAPTAAKVPEAAKVVEKIEPAITPPKPVEKVAPIVAAPTPIEKIAPIVAAAKPVEKVEGVKAAEDEIRFDFDLAPPKKVEAKVAEKPVETAVVAKPVKMPALPVQPKKVELAEEDDLVTYDDETMLMHGSIPEPEAPVLADETTSDEETVVSLPKADEIAARAEADLSDDEPTTDAASTGEVDEPTHVFQGRPSRPEADLPAKVEIDGDSAPKIKDVKVVVSPAVRVPILHAGSTTDETARAIKITEAVPALRPGDSGEATAPSRRYPKPEDEAPLEPLPMQGGKRASSLMLGLVAAALIGAGVFVGLRNGWFEGSSTQGVPTAPTASGPAPTASTAAITTASAAPTASIAPSASAATPEPTTSAGVAPTASASAAPVASAAPSVTASAAPSVVPTAAPVADGDGSNLPANRGYVIINSTKPASVFLTGNFAGLTGNKLEVECGAKFLRLAAPWPGAERPASPAWTSDGRSISVVCRSTTTVAFEATR